jgi:hypothetical protein
MTINFEYLKIKNLKKKEKKLKKIRRIKKKETGKEFRIK